MAQKSMPEKEKRPMRELAKSTSKKGKKDPVEKPPKQFHYVRVPVSADYSVDGVYIFSAESVFNGQISFQAINHTYNYEAYIAYFRRHPGFEHLNELKYPYLYFQAHASSLRILGSNIEIDMNGPLSEDELSAIQTATGLPLTMEDYTAVYAYLSVLQQQYTDYYKKLLEFKWEYGLISFPLFDHVEKIQLMNDWLFIAENHEPLNQRYVYRELKKTLKYIVVNDALFSSLISSLYQLRHERIVDTIDPSVQADAFKNEAYWFVSETGGYIEYIPLENKSVFHCCRSLPSSSRPSAELLSYLELLTDGRIDRLNLIAEFLARVFCFSIPSKYIWTVSVSSIHRFSSFLRSLIGDRANSTLFHLNVNRDSNIILDYLNGVMVQMPDKRFNDSSIYNYKLSKYLSGKELVFSDPFQRYHSVKYAPVILIPTSEPIQEGIPYYSKFKEIKIPESFSRNHYRLTPEDVIWIKICLVTYGLSIIYCNSPTASGIENVYNQFINRYCETDEDARTDTKTFHSYIKAFYEAQESFEPLPGPTKTTEKIVSITNWTVKNDRRNKNRKAYFGVKLNTSQLEEDLRSMAAENRFYAKIEEIRNMVFWPPYLSP